MGGAKEVLICGGGAAGFFVAINIAEKHPKYRITILEKSKNVLSKVRVSGGGRCNVTNERDSPAELVKFYPRGGKKLYSMFQKFSTSDMKSWLYDRGVKTKTEDDLRVFPESNSSDTIISCFLELVRKNNIQLKLQEGFETIVPQEGRWKVTTSKNNKFTCDAIVLACGSAPSVWEKLKDLDIKIEPPVPSLFTFNIKDPRINDLMGLSFQEVEIKIAGTKLKEDGPLLITHWGLSGPAVLKLSAWGARQLHDLNYKFQILINFLPGKNYNQGHQLIDDYINKHPKRKVLNYPLFGLPKRYWECLCSYIGIKENHIFADLGKRSVNKLAEELTQAKYEVSGKSTFKDEFVTCGGVSLSEVNLQTMESNKYKNLYFSGEILDIDAITGGFNFQSCWSGAWIISESI